MFTNLTVHSVAPGGDTAESLRSGDTLDTAEIRLDLLYHSDIDAAFALQTCQRFEVYLQGEHAPGHLRSALEDRYGFAPIDGDLLIGDDAVTHLFRVACGLESGVLGEDEILGQLREARQEAIEADALEGDLEGDLEALVAKAIRVGKRARTETEINQGTVSLGSVTLETVREQRGTLEELDVLIVGAGEVGELVTKALSHREVGTVTVANRTLETAQALAWEIDGEAISLDRVPDRFSTVDVVITATGARDPIVTAEMVADEDLLLVDLANPRDVAPAVDRVPGVDVIELEDVLSVQTTELEQRRRAIPAVESLIDEERTRFEAQLRKARVDDSISSLYTRAEDLRETELERAFDRLDALEESVSDEQRAVIEEFAEAFVSKLLHPKAAALKQAAAADEQERVEAWLDLFERTVDNGATDDEEVAADDPNESSTTTTSDSRLEVLSTSLLH